MKITCHDLFGNSHEFEESEYIKRTSVYGVALQDNKILLVQDAWVHRWELPGGGIDAGEKPEGALAREFREETGLVINDNMQELLVQQEYFLGPNEKTPWHSSRHVYKVQVMGGTLKEDGNNEDVIQAKYFDVEEVKKTIEPTNNNALLIAVLEKIEE